MGMANIKLIIEEAVSVFHSHSTIELLFKRVFVFLVFGVKSALRDGIVIYCLNDKEFSDHIKILISPLLLP